MKKLLFVLLLGFSVSSVMADNWVLTASGDDGSRQYVDRDRVQRVGSNVIYWYKTYGIGKFLEQHWRKNGYPAIANQYKSFSYSLVKTEVNCQRMQFRIINSTDYSKNGTPIESSSTPSAWNEILPESITELTAQKVCSY